MTFSLYWTGRPRKTKFMTDSTFWCFTSYIIHKWSLRVHIKGIKISLCWIIIWILSILIAYKRILYSYTFMWIINFRAFWKVFISHSKISYSFSSFHKDFSLYLEMSIMLTPLCPVVCREMALERALSPNSENVWRFAIRHMS